MWIRAQDRMSLVEPKRLNICKNQGKFRIINQVLYMGDVSDDYDILGEYESKERAIEILDDIQNQILHCTEGKDTKPFISASFQGNRQITYKPVLEMPQK
ncbi:hypothetical protein [Clostridium kluyveri]|uniref:Uncharacterized protein n=2 Tax=Clostridium kluyveri TaxID=1534 RepID=A5N2F7_CLOK5|nr:hypothetical protein [Clostridium kluyveri]EDK35303.1 Hypothetical protein CKL_3300 [Clostridium kluyveri DSM 555]BAH07967.1 hypothetical protein CKR_2916 [Clostridium kluyveri NBRC 12016]